MLSLDKTISVVPTQGTQLAVKYYYLLPIRHISTPTQLSTLSSCTVMSGHATVTKPKKKNIKNGKKGPGDQTKGISQKRLVRYGMTYPHA